MIGKTTIMCAAVGGMLFGTAGLAGQDWSMTSASRLLGEERDVRVRVEWTGELVVRPAEPGTLYKMDLRYDKDAVTPETRYQDGLLEIGVDRMERNIRFGREDRPGRLELALTREVPLHLDLEFGAVHAELELGGMAIRELDLKTGASDTQIDVSQLNPAELEIASIQAGAASLEVNRLGNLNAERIELDANASKATLDFTGEWQRGADVCIDVNLGAVELRFPRGLGVRLITDTVLSSVDAQEMYRRDQEYFSLDWDSAETRITVEVEARVAAVNVVWVP